MGNVVVHHDALRKSRLAIVKLRQLDVEVVVVECHALPERCTEVVALQKGHVDHTNHLGHVVQSHAYGFLSLVLAVFGGNRQALFLIFTITSQLVQNHTIQSLVGINIVEMCMRGIQGVLEHAERDVVRLQRR